MPYDKGSDGHGQSLRRQASRTSLDGFQLILQVQPNMEELLDGRPPF